MKIVTDGDKLRLIQLGQLAIRLSEVLLRARKGVYASIDEVSDAIQLVMEGKAPIIPALAPFTPWQKFRFSDGDIETIILTPADFGYDTPPTMAELLNAELLDTWSRLNVNRLGGRKVEMLSPGDCARIRIRDNEKWQSEIVYMATERQLPGGPETQKVFNLYWRYDGIWVDKQFVYSHYMPGLGFPLLFRLRKV